MKIDCYCKGQWFVIYTRPNSERKVNSLMVERGITSFLPMYSVRRRWSDRIKQLMVPLFPNYLFVKCTEHEVISLSRIRGIVRFLTTEGRPVTVQESVINTLQKVIQHQPDICVLEGCQEFKKGTEIQIDKGVLAGARGIVVNSDGNTKLMVELECLNRVVSVRIPFCYVSPVPRIS